MGSAFAARRAGQYAATPAVTIIRIAAPAKVGKGRGLFPALGFGLELSASDPSQTIEARSAVVLRGPPLGRDGAFLLQLTSGGQRTIDTADSARVDEHFFTISRWYPDLKRSQTVLTLRSEDVIGAEILKDGIRIDYVPGRGQAKI